MYGMMDDPGMMQMGFNDGYMEQGLMDPGCMSPYDMGLDMSMLGPMKNYKGPRDNPQFNLDEQLLLNLGFFPEEIAVMANVVSIYGYVTTQKLNQPPFCIYEPCIVKRIMYAYKISMNDTIIDTTDIESIAKHFKKLNAISNKRPTFSCFYVKHKAFDKIARVAVVRALPEGSFSVLNSDRYDITESIYPVDKIAKEWVTIRSLRPLKLRPVDRLNDSYNNREWGIEGVLKVEEVGDVANKKPWIIKIHKSNCRLCNRFMVVITTRKVMPGVTEHHGGYEMVMADGTLLYIYARTTDIDSYGNPKETFPNTTNDTVVFSYGFYPSQIRSKVLAAVKAVSTMMPIVFSQVIEGSSPFTMIPPYSGMESINESSEDEEEVIEDFVD